jgi:hypothetical protein
MEATLILTLIGIIILFGLSNLAFLNANDFNIKKLKKYVFYTTLSIVFISFMIGFLLFDELTFIDKLLYFFIGIFINPLLIIFPLSSMSVKISPYVSNILSKTLLIIYTVVLLIGLIGMTSSGNTWGNSGLLSGVVLVVWALPNILLATIMSNDFRFTGITKLVLGILSLLIIIITIKDSEYTGDSERSFRTIAFLTCVYFTFEGYLFIAKHKMIK